jgi:hypothetical protein
MKTDNITTTIKLNKETKERLDNLKEYRRETYEELLQKILQILNLCKISPAKARFKLISIDRKRKRETKIVRTQKSPQAGNL